VLWDELVSEWGLSAEERGAIDRQQGQRCVSCGCSLRASVLARGIACALGETGPLRGLHRPGLRVLEVNGAAQLSEHLARLGRTTRAEYPSVDLQSLPYADGSFDMVVHSDTLEHVPDAASGLRECRRVLAPGGVLAMTVPIVPDRATRTRVGLPESFHGSRETRDAGMRVWWEFGADAWVMVARAGFGRIELVTQAFPAAVAVVARAVDSAC
jgi:SAM-dependent methyltransferase